MTEDEKQQGWEWLMGRTTEAFMSRAAAWGRKRQDENAAASVTQVHLEVGKRVGHASHNTNGWLCMGFFGGPAGVVAAYKMEPDMPIVIWASAEEFEKGSGSGVAWAYAQERRRLRKRDAWMGFAVEVALAIGTAL